MALRRRSALKALVPAVFALSACSLPGAGAGSLEGTIRQDGAGNVVMHVQGHQLTLKGPDASALDGLQLLVGGRVYRAVNGHLSLPSSVSVAQGAVVILAPGFVPQTVAANQLDSSITLIPAQTVASGTLPDGGGQVRTADGSLGVKLAPGAATDVTVARYQPASAPSHPPLALGVLLTLSAPADTLAPTYTFDLQAMLHGWDGQGSLPASAAGWTQAERDNAQAAAAILAARHSADPAALQKEGLTLTGSQLTVTLPPAKPAYDGNVKVSVTSAELGVYLEFTTVVPVGGGLPPILAGGPSPVTAPVALASATAVAGGGTLISNNGGNVVSNNSAGILSTYGGGILSTYGGGLISDGGSSLQGEVRSPFQAGFEPNQSKYALLNFTDVLVPNAGQVLLASEIGQILGPTSAIDGASRYKLTNFPPVRPIVFPEAQIGSISMRALAPAPKTRDILGADINAATTGAASWAVNRMATGGAKMKQIRYAGYQADVTALRGFMNQADAGAMVTGNVSSDAALANSLYLANSYSPQVFRTISGLVTNVAGSGVRGLVDGTGTGAELFTNAGLDEDASGVLFVADAGNNAIRRVTQAGVVTTVPFTGLTLSNPISVAVHPAGYLLVCDQGNDRIVKIDLATNIASVWVPSAGSPRRIAVAPDGTAYYTGFRPTPGVYKVLPGGGSSLVAGKPYTSGSQDGPSGSATFNTPVGIVPDDMGNLYVCDRYNNAIRKVDLAAGTVSTLSTQVGSPIDIAYDSANEVFYVFGNLPGTGSAVCAIHRVDMAGHETFIAGNPSPGRVDGFGSAAGFYAPGGMHFDSDTGILWETDGDCVRKVE